MTWYGMDIYGLIAALINSVLVVAAVQFLKVYWPIFKEKMPWLIPIIAGFIGPLIMLLQNMVTSWLGVPVDLSPLLGVLTGGTAVAIHQVYKQTQK